MVARPESLSDHLQWKWSETRSFKLQLQLNNLKWSSFILSTLCSQREYISQVVVKDVGIRHFVPLVERMEKVAHIGFARAVISRKSW